MRWTLLIALVAGCTHQGTAPVLPHEETPGSAAAVEPAPPGTTPPPAGTPVPVTTPVAPPVPPPTKIKVVVRSSPPKATVFWGKKKLGDTPVTLERPRDSGPVDLVVRLEGHFPVHTRAYSFRNDTVYVKLTKLEERMSILGAKEPPPPPPPTTPPPEAAPGAPEPPAPAPPAPAPLQ
jgi:hypothetical protein